MRGFRFWTFVSNAKGRYFRGSSGSLLRQQVGPRDVTPDDLEHRIQRSALFKIMFHALLRRGAKRLAVLSCYRARIGPVLISPSGTSGAQSVR